MTILCDTPILIPNPNYKRKVKLNTPDILKDCTSQYIKIPCGHCPSCISSKQLQIVQRVQMESLVNHVFFCTLTYRNETMPRLTTSTGYDFRYADIRDVQNMMKRLRKYDSFGRPFKYFCVSERGSKYARPHFHILFFVPKDDKDNWMDILNLEDRLRKAVLSQWTRNIGSTRFPKYVDLCKYVEVWQNGVLRKTYDLHYVDDYGSDRGTSVAFYVIKYMLKPSTNETRLQQALKLNLPEDEYLDTWKIIRSRHVSSKDFGSSKSPIVIDYLRNCVKMSISAKTDFPCFYNPDDGRSFPLARFYKNKGSIYTFDDAVKFKRYNGVDNVFDEKLTPQESSYKLYKNFIDYEKKISITDKYTYVDLGDDLYE